MNLSDFIRNLQEKPKVVRFQILWISVAICMAFVVFVWVISLEKVGRVAEENEREGQKLDMPGVWSSISSSFNSIRSEAEEKIKQKEKELKELNDPTKEGIFEKE